MVNKKVTSIKALAAAVIVNLAFNTCALSQEDKSEPLAKKAVQLGQISNQNLLKGEVNYLVPQGTVFSLKLASIPTNGMHLLDRDLDGKLYPAKLGAEITAKTSEDIYVDDKNVIPEGTVFHGTVSKLLPPRTVNRNGWLQISFSHFTTPDGRTFSFNAQADNFKPSTAKSKLKATGYLASHAAGGAVVGALAAWYVCGTHYTLAMHGYNIAGGAAAGALMATCYAVAKHGDHATLEPGDDFNMQIDTDLLMPAAVEATHTAKYINRAGIDIKVAHRRIEKDGLGGYLYRVDATINNDTDQPLKSVDIFCKDDNEHMLPIIAGTDFDSEFLFEVEAHSEKHVIMNFQVEFPKVKRQLVCLDHDSREICYRSEMVK